VIIEFINSSRKLENNSRYFVYIQGGQKLHHDCIDCVRMQEKFRKHRNGFNISNICFLYLNFVFGVVIVILLTDIEHIYKLVVPSQVPKVIIK
jgi:hypothetical protein